MELADSLTVPANASIVIGTDDNNNPAELTVPAGKTLTVDGKLDISGGRVVAAGTLQNNNRIECSSWDGGPVGEVVIDGGTYAGLGELAIQAENPQEHLIGIDLESLDSYEDGDWMVYTSGRYITSFDELKYIVDNFAGIAWKPVNYVGEGSFTFEDNITIPEFLDVEFSNENADTVIIPENVTVKNYGECYFFHVQFEGTYENYGYTVVRGMVVDSADHIVNSGDFEVWRFFNEDMGIEECLQLCAENAPKLPENAIMFASPDGDVTLTKDLTIPANMRVALGNGDGEGRRSVITVPSGVTLTVEGMLRMVGGGVTVESGGALANLGEIYVGVNWYESIGTGHLVIEDGALYDGPGVLFDGTETEGLVGIDLTQFDSSVEGFVRYVPHAWGEIIYTWAADYSEATATRRCLNGEGHEETETVKTTSVTTPASCEDAGKTVYTATFANEAFGVETKTVAITPLGHDWGEWTVSKAATYTEKGERIRECANCHETEREEIAILKPNAPTISSAASVAASGYPQIKWAAVDGAKTYTVYRSTGSGYTAIETGLTAKTYTDTTAAAGTKYYYRVKAEGEGGISESSAYEAVTCKLAQPVITLSNVASSGKIKVSWKAIDGAVDYTVYRATSSTGEFKVAYTTTNTSYTNTGATAGYTYYYKVVANAKNTAASSAESSVKSRTCDLARPVITLTNVASSGKIKISWEPVAKAEGYTVYRATSSTGTYYKLGTTTKTSYTNTGAVAGKTYYYKVVANASKAAADSAYSTAKSRTCDLERPVVTISVVASSGKPRLSWKAIEGAVNYTVYRSTSSSGTYTKMLTTKNTYYTNTNAVAGKTYYYKVVANASVSAANSAYSTAKSVVCILARPDVSVKLNSSGKPRLTWDEVNGAKNYTIYSATSQSGPYSKLTTTSNTYYTHTKAVKGTTYYYKVVASAGSAASSSADSAVVSVKSK